MDLNREEQKQQKQLSLKSGKPTSAQKYRPINSTAVLTKYFFQICLAEFYSYFQFCVINNKALGESTKERTTTSSTGRVSRNASDTNGRCSTGY